MKDPICFYVYSRGRILGKHKVRNTRSIKSRDVLRVDAQSLINDNLRQSTTGLSCRSAAPEKALWIYISRHKGKDIIHEQVREIPSVEFPGRGTID